MSLVGRHIGRYRILEQLGQGGMSVVYKGLDTALDREVAVKVLHPHLAGKEESRRRLAREAKAVAKLHHPNILEVYDFAGADAPDAYIVTEYIRGQTLRQFAGNQAFEPPEIAAMVVHQIAAALAHAHEAGVIHRDLKPENVMVREDGVLKLMDFGIAKILDRDDKMTMTGALVGSPAHMAPEIIEGEDAGPEADVFSLGTMLYLFATSRLPFAASNTTATLKRILDGVYEDPRQLVPTVSDDLAEIIATCLMRQPSARYPDSGKLSAALAEYLERLGVTQVDEELASFFADAPCYRKQLVPRLTEALLARSERLLHEKRPAKALSGLNQVLALDGQNARALGLLQQMNATRRRRQTLATSSKMAGLVAALGLVAAFGYAAHERSSHAKDYPMPLGQVRGTEVPIASAVFPTPTRPEPFAPPVLRPAVVPLARPSLRAGQEKRGQPAAAAPTPIQVRVLIRPHGYLQVDNEPRTEDHNIHQLRLAPGLHRFKVTCDFCVPEGAIEQRVVSAPMDDVHLVAPVLPGRLSFSGFPPEALVRVGTEQRKVAETMARPFLIKLVPERLKDGKHHVSYEVSLPGYQSTQGEAEIPPGALRVISGSLKK